MARFFLGCSTALLFLTALVFVQASPDLPQRFASREAAAQAGCRFHRVKGAATDTCVFTVAQGDPMPIGIYDRSADGRYVIANELKIPSWSWSAKVSFDEVLQAGTDCLVIDTAGMHGTAISQRALLLIGWDGARFRTAAVESLRYGCFRPTAAADYEMKVSYSFATANGGRRLQLAYSLTRDNQEIGRWNDSLRWDAARFAFVTVPSAIDASNPTVSSIRERIARVRAYLLAHPFDPAIGSDRSFADSGLMDVLDPVCVQ